MGLNISVYQNITETKDESYFDFCAYVIDDSWKWKIKNLTDGAFYDGDGVFDFDCTYGHHKWFRGELLCLTGHSGLVNFDGSPKFDKVKDMPEMPFHALIWFADNEGCLDWEVSETLYQDFVKYEASARERFSQTYLNLYLNWLTAFEKARHHGVVVFR